MVNSGDITVTNYRLRKAMSNLNDDDFSQQGKKLAQDLKSELSLKVGQVTRIYPVKDKAVVELSGKEETCLIAHDILSEGMNVIGFPKGTTRVDTDGTTYIVPSEKIYGLVMPFNDDEKALISFISLSDKSVFGNPKPGEYKVQVDDNIISVTDKYINIKSKNFFINGLPYVEAYTPLDDYHDKEEIKEITDKIDDKIKNIADVIYPVGAIYMSVNNTSPSVLFGGVWEQIEDRFLLASGSNYSAGSTGGEATHTLTVSEIPSHRHSRRTQPQGFAEQDKTKSEIISPASGSAKAVTKYSDYTGGGGSHNNMPPYLTVYMWKRVS